jgi:hypothetical protein
MAKPKDNINRRIEAVWSNIGLGNADAESIEKFVDDYERAMNTAAFAANNKGKKKFKDVLAAEEKKVEEKKE